MYFILFGNRIHTPVGLVDNFYCAATGWHIIWLHYAPFFVGVAFVVVVGANDAKGEKGGGWKKKKHETLTGNWTQERTPNQQDEKND